MGSDIRGGNPGQPRTQATARHDCSEDVSQTCGSSHSRPMTTRGLWKHWSEKARYLVLQ